MHYTYLYLYVCLCRVLYRVYSFVCVGMCGADDIAPQEPPMNPISRWLLLLWCFPEVPVAAFSLVY